jgi:hypothetical protein
VQTPPGMTFVPESRLFPRKLWRPVLFTFAIAQVLLAFSPVVEGQRGAGASAHVEAAGTSLHHGHDESGCVACLARGMVAGTHPPASPALPFASATSSAINNAELPAMPAVADTRRSRAPPASIA